MSPMLLNIDSVESCKESFPGKKSILLLAICKIGKREDGIICTHTVFAFVTSIQAM